MGHTPEQRDEMPLCGAKKKKTGESCRALAGQGTSHLGIGRCKFHGGSTPNHQKAAVVVEAKRRMVTLGRPIEVQPHDALLALLHTSAGHVAWINQEIADANLRTFEGQVLTQLYGEERDRMARIAEVCIRAGISERLVEMAEKMGEMIAPVLKAVFEDPELELSAVQRRQLPEVVRRHLATLEGRRPAAIVGLVREQ